MIQNPAREDEGWAGAWLEKLAGQTQSLSGVSRHEVGLACGRPKLGALHVLSATVCLDILSHYKET